MGSTPGSLDQLRQPQSVLSATRPAGLVSPRLYWTWGILLLLPVWLPRYWPTEDGFAHLYWIEVYRSLGRPDSPFSAFFVRNLVWDAPYHMLHLGLQYGLASILDPHTAQKVVVSLAILSWVVAIHHLAKTLHRGITLGGFAALGLIHSSWLYNGFFAFIGAMPLVLLTMALLVRLNTSGGDRMSLYIAIGLTAAIAHYAHFFVGAMILMLGTAWLLFPWRPLVFRRIYLAGALFPTALLALWYFTRGTLGGGGMSWESPLKVVARFVGLAFFRGFAAPTPSFWLALTGFAALLAILTVSALRTEPLRTISQSRLFVFGFCGLLMAAYFIAPAGVGEAWPFHARLHFTALALLIPSLSPRLSLRASRLVTGLICLILGWQIVTFSARGVRLSNEYANIIREAGALPQRALISSSLIYGNARYDDSFVHVLATVPEDIAYRRRAVLLGSFFTDRPYYWVRPRPGPPHEPEFRIDVQRTQQRRLMLLIEQTR